ncbi:hypothetical protein JG687_00011816 [Phytophthora cactorum]|uniref:CFAP47-like immunoglobulin-like domain-containing protein n=1 Tax=Phytophthora cactorum TaxID=29920 RepID=A0A8T1U7B9_9STRA|nr:hypothetical protein JG687_00011816 [Phytophthora cactorum]
MPTSGIVGRPSTPCGLRGDRTASALQVAPSVVDFSAFERGSCYVATFNVRNGSDRVLRFRLTPPPHASPFKVLLRGRDLARTENATVCLPAGLSVKYEVTFELPGSDEDSEPEVATPAIVHDALQLKGDDGSSLEVPLMARRACPLLEVTPPLCELGLVVLTQRSARCVEVQNCGARSGRFVVEVLAANDNSTKAAIAVSPQRGKLAPLESVNVKVEANGLETGDFRGIVRVRIWETDEYEDDQHATTSAAPAAEKIVDVSGSVVEHTAELVLRQGLEPVHSLFFGSLFAGETRTIETLLRNNGPQPLTFKTSISFGGSAGAIEEDREAYERRKELQISPADGCIDPFSEALVTFIYHPRAKTPEEIHRIERNQGAAGDQDGEYTGSAHSLDSSSPFTLLPAPAQPLTAFASIICEDLQAQNLTFEVSAKTYVPRLQLSPPPPLDFGDVRSYDRADILLSLKNLSGLPVRFEAPKDVPHYSVNPRTGRLDVLQSQSLVVSFAPTQLGTFNSILALQINGGVLEIPLKVLGRAAVVGPVPPVNERLVGGPLALPADFAPKFKFLLPEEAKQAKGKLSRRFQRQPPYELAALNGTAALDEFEFQGTNNTHLTYCVKELARRADHRAAYQDYLAQSRAQREAKAKGGKGKAQNLKKRVAQARGGNQEEDKEDVDLGMARPQPQELRLPLSLAKTNDPLWLNQHPTGGNSGQSKAFFDEFKGVKRKFKSAPATPAELADCARTLEFDELEQVVSGPKTLNFGRLSVNGSATRSLTVQNNLQQNVLVALPLGKDGASGSPEELARKTPLTSQVVPPHSKAGFDLVFSSSREQFFQQTITYSINGVHPRQVTIVAEVAPIVVELAPEDLRFDFGALDLSSSTAREVVITNTCDSEAPFLWTRMPMVATPDGSTRPESSKSNATTTVTTTTMADRSSNANTTTVFEVIPASGTLGPSATLVCKVVYTPPAMTRPMMAALGITQKTGAVWLAQMFQLDVTGGEKGFLNCRALLPEVKVVSREKKVDFGTISVGVEREKKLTLANLGMHTRAVFYASIEPQSMSTTVGLQVSPAQGVVDPQESTEVSVKLFPHRAITLDGTSGSQVNIIVTIRGGKVLRLPVNASVLVPDVFLAPADAIDYGEVVIGVSVPRVISMENHSSIPACLLLDLGASSISDEFSLATPPRLLAHLEDASNIFVPLTDDKLKEVEDTTGTDATASEFTIESNDIVLDPGETLAFVVTFRPRFSRKITARLVFQAVRGDLTGSSSIGGGGATMVFLLESNIVSRKPVRVIQLETKTYEKRVEEILIENQFPTNANFKLSMTQQSTQIGAESTTGIPNSGSSTMGVLPTSRGGTRRRSVQPGNQGRNSVSSFGMGTDASGFGRKKSIISGKNRGEDGDFSWCIAAQQPFYLPDFGTSGSSNNDDGIDGGGLSVPSSGLSGASISIRKNGSAKVKLEFLPLVPGNYRCQLLFLDESIGEFLYEIHAVATLPASLETLEIQCEASTAASATGPGAAARFRFVRELTIPVKNPQLNRALTTFIERANGHLRAKLKDGLKKCEENHVTNFHVDFNSPYFTANIPELTLTAGSGKPVPVSGRSDTSGIDSSGPKVPLKANQARLCTPRSVLAGTNSVLIDFQPKGAGRYACKLLLRSRNSICGSSDVRVYDLIAKVREPNVKTQLEFVAPARHSIVQEIPLSNPTDTTWSLKAVFSNGNTDSSASKPPASMFSGPPALVVPAKRSATYPLTFTPSWMYHETRTFVLLNTATQQQFEFELSGYGEEPLAQDHVVFSCQARTSIVHNFNVFALPGGDANAAQVFKVESDLRDVVGASTITVPAGSGSNRSVKYSLTFSPLVSGSYFGSVTFTNEATNEYLWYTVEAFVSPPEPETTLEMRAPVRGAVGVEIGLANPLDSETTFTVELRGRGLLGPSTFTLEARQSGVYELVYSPLLMTKDSEGEEGAILFSSDAVGQFWYRLNLVAEAAETQELDDMACAVGDVCTQPLWLQNPSDQELQLQYRISNTRNFSIKGSNSTTNSAVKRVVLPPFGRASVVVEYTPSSLSVFESTSIVFFEKDVASDWEFTVRGRGRAPSVMKPLVVTAQVNEAASTLFTFKNPFAAPLRVDVKLVADESENSPPSPVFDMLLKKRHVLLESFGLLQVPISFIPRVVSETRAELVIHGGDEYAELEWRYPLRGVAEAPLHPRVLAVLACQARDSVEKRVECELLAAPDDMVLANEMFTVEWEIDADRFGPMATAAAIERALTVTPFPVPSSSGSFILPYTIRFEPLRLYRGSIALLVKKNSGGLWRFDVSLDAGDPPVDDVLSIESSLNQTSSVSFQLRNQFRQPAAFLAEFSAGSSSAFTVYPAEGELPPYGSENGAMFVVSFTPTGYGKMQSGQLVICTEEMQWTFNVKGVYPDATPGSRASGPTSSLSLSSTASRARLGITNGGTSEQRVDRARGRGTRNRP